MGSWPPWCRTAEVLDVVCIWWKPEQSVDALCNAKRAALTPRVWIIVASSERTLEILTIKLLKNWIRLHVLSVVFFCLKRTKTCVRRQRNLGQGLLSVFPPTGGQAWRCVCGLRRFSNDIAKGRGNHIMSLSNRPMFIVIFSAQKSGVRINADKSESFKSLDTTSAACVKTHWQKNMSCWRNVSSSWVLVRTSGVWKQWTWRILLNVNWTRGLRSKVRNLFSNLRNMCSSISAVTGWQIIGSDKCLVTITATGSIAAARQVIYQQLGKGATYCNYIHRRNRQYCFLFDG